jgi:hypothetical protein
MAANLLASQKKARHSGAMLSAVIVSDAWTTLTDDVMLHRPLSPADAARRAHEGSKSYEHRLAHRCPPCICTETQTAA